MSSARRVPGACLCGGVRFTLTLPTLFCAHCHCSMCRRNHGAAYVTWIGAARVLLALRHVAVPEWTELGDALPRLGGRTGLEPRE